MFSITVSKTKNIRFWQLLLLLSTTLLAPEVVYSQMLVGGPDNMPGEVKAGALNEGSVSGDVNMFNGTYDLTHTLGTVSGINGPNFTLTASYSSTVNTGTLSPSHRGFPYGEGWSLNLPSVSCSVEDYEKYNASQREFMATMRSSGWHIYYLPGEISEEKSNYFFNVNFSIPGVSSGKLVYKYSLGEQHHFSPQAFDSPITAVLDGGRWLITAANGDRYEFLPVPTLRENGNLRTHKFRSSRNPDIDEVITYTYTTCDGETETRKVFHYERDEDFNQYQPSQETNIEPREVVPRWYCSKISNPMSTDAIFFNGEPYGKEVNFFSNWDQPALQKLGHNNPYVAQPKYWEGGLITSISSSIEELELNYENISSDEPSGKISEVDLMYEKELIFDGKKQRNIFRRYKHAAKVSEHYLQASDFFDSSNPYVYSLGGQGEYVYDEESLRLDDISFNHGFLESPAIDIPQHGDFYKVEFTISNDENSLLLDLNVAAGKQVYGSNRRLSASIFNSGRAIDLFSTFHKPVKFYSRKSNVNAKGTTTFSSFFSAPPLHSDNKIFVQVGPASSSNDFSNPLTPPPFLNGLASAPTIPYTLMSYHASNTSSLWTFPGNNSIGTDRESFPNGVYPTDPAPANFGLGIPWHGMLHFYDSEIYGPNLNGNDRWLSGTYPGSDLPNFTNEFWWMTSIDRDGHEWENKPTTAGEGVRLKDIKVYLYRKKKLALASVKKNIIGNIDADFIPTRDDVGGIKHQVTNTQLQYEVVENDFRVSFDGDNIGNGGTTDNGSIKTLLLRSIVSTPIDKEIPIIKENSALDYPTTHFGYERIGDNNDLLPSGWQEISISGIPSVAAEKMANFPNTYLLDKHVSPLGKKTKIQYQAIGASNAGGSYLHTLKSEAWRNPRRLDPAGDYEGIYFPQQDNFAAKLVAIVNRTEILEQKNKRIYYHYSFADGQVQNNLTKPHKNLKEGYVRPNGHLGFAKAIKYGPTTLESGCSDCPKSTLHHHTDQLLWGKLQGSLVHDTNGNLVSKTSNDYSTSLAFEPGFARETALTSDYGEYSQVDRPRPNLEAQNILSYVDAIGEYHDEDYCSGTRVRSMPNVSSQKYFSPWVTTPNHINAPGFENDTESIWFNPSIDGYEAVNNFMSESSYFVKLNSTQSTMYDHCENNSITETTGVVA